MQYLLRALSTLLLTLAAPHWVMALDIVPVQIISQSDATRTNVPVTFGQVFKPGDVSASAALTAQLSDNTVVPLQVDKKATHRDGSLRHAVITARIPSLVAGATQSLMLATGTPPARGSDIVLANLLASGFDAEVSLSLGGTVYRAAAKDLLRNGKPSQWLDGDLVSEWIVGAPVKDGAGKAHPHLAAYFHVRAYSGPTESVSRVRVDVVVENNWSYQENPRNFTYDAIIRIAGNTEYTRNIKHYHHARWNQQFWWRGDPQIAVGHDRDYLLDSRAITHYDRSIQISEKLFNDMLTNWDPMSNGSISDYMPATGAHKGIGPLPRWTAAYVISQDPRAKTATLLNGRASGSYSMHYRDQNTGLPVSLDDHPKAGRNSGDFPTYGSPAGTPLTEDTAHQPDLAFVPYLVTGDYFFLEELQFWGNYNMLQGNPKNRGGGGSHGLIINSQDRGQAWGMRALGEAAYATPDAHPLKNYFNEKVLNNIANYNTVYSNGEGTSERWNVFGALRPNGKMASSRPWMDDFFTWAIGHLVEMGFTEAIPLRDWKAQYPVGRMTKMCYIEAVNYNPKLGTDKPPVFFASWAEFYEVNYGSRTDGGGAFRDLACASKAMADWKVAANNKGSKGSSFLPGEMSGRAFSDDSYYANAQPAMAIAKDSGINDASIAWALFIGENTDSRFPYPGTPYQPSYVDAPQWAVVPREGQTPRGPKPVIALSAEPNVVQSQGTTTLDWSANNADTCTASGDWSGDKGISGSELVGPLGADAVFRLSCTGSAGAAMVMVAVSIDLAGGGTSGGGTSGGGTSGGGTSGGGTSGGGTSGGGTSGGGTSGGGTSGGGASGGGSGDGGSGLVLVTGMAPDNYEWGTLSRGSDVYIDRGFTYRRIPAIYDRMDYLRTANEHKVSMGDSAITFTVDRDVTVYVAHVYDSARRPDWLAGWTDTGDQLVNTDRTLFVYRKDFRTGLVTLGGNNGAPSMYTVLMEPAPANGTSGGGTSGGGTSGGGTSGGGGSGGESSNTGEQADDGEEVGAGSFDLYAMLTLLLGGVLRLAAQRRGSVR